MLEGIKFVCRFKIRDLYDPSDARRSPFREIDLKELKVVRKF